MKSSSRAHLFLLICQIIYAITFVVAKVLMRDHIGPFALVMLRGLGATPLFWLADAFFIKEKTDRKDLPRLFLLCLFGVTINQTLFISGLNLTSPISAAIMMITTPILVVVVAGFLIREKITWVRTTGIFLGFAGAATLMLNSGLNAGGKEDNPFGDLLIFINALSWGTYLVLVKPLMKKYHTITILRWTFTFSMVFIIPIGFNQLMHVNWQTFTPTAYGLLFFVIFFTTFIAYLLNVYALKELSPAVVSAYIYLQPVLTAIIAIGTGNDSISGVKVFSALLIFAGVYLVSNSSTQVKVKE
ncbi:MAG: DMT family transporter [Bacteroidetes bacterium]|nr:DMT family transporter [Bacteroidota bacterium]